MEDKVIEIISQILNIPIEQLDDDSSPDTIENWDSLRHMNLILALEEELGVTLSDDEVVEMLSVKKIVRVLSKKEAKGSAISE